MAINGFVTAKDLRQHAAEIVHKLGLATYLRCWLALALGSRTGLLDAVFACLSAGAAPADASAAAPHDLPARMFTRL